MPPPKVMAPPPEARLVLAAVRSALVRLSSMLLLSSWMKPLPSALLSLHSVIAPPLVCSVSLAAATMLPLVLTRMPAPAELLLRLAFRLTLLPLMPMGPAAVTAALSVAMPEVTVYDVGATVPPTMPAWTKAALPVLTVSA